MLNGSTVAAKWFVGDVSAGPLAHPGIMMLPSIKNPRQAKTLNPLIFIFANLFLKIG